MDEELQLVHPKPQIAGLKRAQRAAAELLKGSKGSKGRVWLPPGGCLETWPICGWGK
jgi:hypothetical protein